MKSTAASDTRQKAWRGSRRDFVKNSVLAGAALTGGAAVGPAPTTARAQSVRPSGKLPMRLAGYRLDRVEALVGGRVGVEGCDVEFEVAAIGERGESQGCSGRAWAAARSLVGATP